MGVGGTHSMVEGGGYRRGYNTQRHIGLRGQRLPQGLGVKGQTGCCHGYRNYSLFRRKR